MANVVELIPEVNLIKDEKIRENLISAVNAIEKESGVDLAQFPLGHGITEPGSLMSHSRALVKMALAVADVIEEINNIKVNRDYLIAGCILHDIAIVYGRENEIKHSFTGAFLARDHNLPEEIVKIVATHAKEGELVKRSLEATIVYHVDFMHLEILTGEHYTQVIVRP